MAEIAAGDEVDDLVGIVDDLADVVDDLIDAEGGAVDGFLDDAIDSVAKFELPAMADRSLPLDWIERLVLADLLGMAAMV